MRLVPVPIRTLVLLLLASLVPAVGFATGSSGAAAAGPPPGVQVQAPQKSPAKSPAEAPAKKKKITLFTLSTRSDLVSDGNAIVVVQPAKGLRRSDVRVRQNGRDVTRKFALRRGGRYAAYLTGLTVGRNVLTATSPGRTGRLVIINHPNGGPVFSGPQHRPYRCQPTARDAQCNQPARFSYLYRSTNPLKAGLQPYNPARPARDVAVTTTDQGVRVPFIVRREDGFQARDRYTYLALWQPGKKWTRWAPQRQFNHKLLITHGGSCGASYAPGEPRLEDYAGTIPSNVPGITQSYISGLGRGFAVLSTALNNTGHNCNVAVEAESLVLAKERFVEQYGAIRYTIGTGCSGGSIAQHTIANAYPGIYQGLLTTCSYPDVLTAGAQFADYHLLRTYFEDPSTWAPGVAWNPAQFAAVEGHLSHLNAVVSDEALFKSALNPENACDGTLDPVAGNTRTRYDSEINPAGVRCSALDMMTNLLGRRPTSVWSPQEKQAGRGFAGIPIANVGVQYGLGAWKAGLISTEQFLDVNANVGGFDINFDKTADRFAGDPASIARAYRTGLVNEATNLQNVAMINFGGPDPGIAHDYAHAFWTEDRLQRAQGHTDNRVMWFGVVPLIGDLRWADEALVKMDNWLGRVERDDSRRSLAAKIVADKPTNVTDRCSNVPGVLQKKGANDEIDCVLPDVLQTRLSTPREVAGGTRFNDVVSCRLRPLARSDYDFTLVPLTDAQWGRLQQTFPDGVCDYRKYGNGQQPAQTWLGYGSATTPVYGGRNLPPVRGRDADGWASTSFRALLRQ